MWQRSWPCQGREQQWRICVCSGCPRATVEDQGSSTQACERSPMRDELECGCEANEQGRTGMLRSTRTTQSRKRNERERGYAKLLKPSRNSRERTSRSSRCANRCEEDTRNCFTKTQRIEPRAKRNSCITMSRSCSAYGKDGTGTTTKAGGSIWSCAEEVEQIRCEEVEYIHPHKMYTRVPREVCLRETGRAPIKTGWAETDKGQPGKPNVRARWVAKEYKTHARPELYASTPPLEALKVVLSEIATGKRRGKVVALVDVRRAYFYAPARRRVFVELPPEDYQAGDEDMCGLLQYSLYGTRDAAQNWEEELTSTLSDLKLTRGVACPCVWRGHIKGDHVVATSRSVVNDRQWNSSSERYRGNTRSRSK